MKTARYRLVGGVLALAVSVVALLTAPQSARADFWVCGDTGCVNWTEWGGCSQIMYCCVNTYSGDYACAKINVGPAPLPGVVIAE